MEKIISFTDETMRRLPGTITGWMEDDDEYKAFRIGPDSLEFAHSYFKNEFKNYEHFVGVQSKFDPYLFFFAHPIEVKSFTFPEVSAAFTAWEKTL